MEVRRTFHARVVLSTRQIHGIATALGYMFSQRLGVGSSSTLYILMDSEMSAS